MTWRIVSVGNTAKLDLRMNYLVVRGKELRKIHLSEISVLIIETTAVSLTAALVCELLRRKIKIIFCDEKRNPCGEVIPYYGRHDSTDRLRVQIGWKESSKKQIWAEIIRHKITNQRNLLFDAGLHEQAALLDTYIDDIQPGDSTNREGHAAKVYFNALFGMDFSRRDSVSINACLNYGYAILLSAVNRDIVSLGYNTQLGIFHDNMFNCFNLGSDIMEPLRPLIDRFVYETQPEELDSEMKRKLVDVLNSKVVIEGKRNYLNNAMKIYCKSVLDAMDVGDISLLRFCKYEDTGYESDCLF